MRSDRVRRRHALRLVPSTHESPRESLLRRGVAHDGVGCRSLEDRYAKFQPSAQPGWRKAAPRRPPGPTTPAVWPAGALPVAFGAFSNRGVSKRVGVIGLASLTSDVLSRYTFAAHTAE